MPAATMPATETTVMAMEGFDSLDDGAR